MSIIIGIDVGGSTTKIVGFKDSHLNLINPMFVKAGDPLASVFGAFGKFTSINKIKLEEIDKVMITGVGSSYIDDKLYNIPTEHISEFECIGLGGLYLSSLKEAIIVSMGTGTALVNADITGKNVYMGGTGVGGGSLIGLSKKILGVSNIEHIVELAKDGDLGNIDLRIADITKKDIIPTLPPKATAANFGKLSDIASNSDIALGILNLVFESIGMLSVFAARSCNLKDIVLTGNLSTLPQVSSIFDALSQMFDMKFTIPENSQYATVIGAALNRISKSI